MGHRLYALVYMVLGLSLSLGISAGAWAEGAAAGVPNPPACPDKKPSEKAGETQADWDTYAGDEESGAIGYASKAVSNVQEIKGKSVAAAKAAELEGGAGVDGAESGKNKSGSNRMTNASGHATEASSQATLCQSTARKNIEELRKASKGLYACVSSGNKIHAQNLAKYTGQLASLEKECVVAEKGAQTMMSSFKKNALIIGGLAAGGAAIGFGVNALMSKDKKDVDSQAAAKAACDKVDGMEFKDGTCKSKSALAECPEDFVKDADGYCVMKTADGSTLASSTPIAPSGESSNAVNVPTSDLEKLNDKGESKADKALAALQAGESDAGVGSGAGSAGTGGASGAGAAGGGRSGASAGSGGSGGGSGRSGGGYGSSGGGEDGEKDAAGVAREGRDNPLRWRNTSSSDKDLPISRRRRLQR